MVILSAIRRSLSSMKTFAAIVEPHSWTLPRDCGIRRDAPRPLDDRQPGYEEQYDRLTVFYDCFNADGRVVLSGPPLMNLRRPIFKAEWRVDGRKVRMRPSLFDRGRSQESHLTVPRRASRLEIRSEFAQGEMEVGSELRRHFRGRKTLVTISKDNELEWISDWLRFYVGEHGTDAVVLYDNDSTRYDEEQLLETLVRVRGVKVAVVVPWDFMFGPLGSPKGVYDSDYCQYAMLEHARQRFLKDAGGVINCDIDELVITNDRKPVYTHAARSINGAILYQGRMIEKAVETELAPSQVRHFGDFLYYDPSVAPASPKWCAIPSRLPSSSQWRLHSITEVRMPYDSKVMHRHFKGINTNWRRYKRPEVPVDAVRHLRDETLAEVLAQRLGQPAKSA